MIVEFVGASGSGKTTLTRDVARHLSGFGDVVTASDLVVKRWKLKRVTHPTMCNIVADISSVVDVPRLNSSERAFLRYAFRRLSMHRSHDLQTLNYCRSVIRRTGMNSYARRVGSGRIVLADEGIVLVAYLLFVYGGTSYDDDDLAEFATIVPLPDRIVHVKVPLESLTLRATTRVDRRRELSVEDRCTLERQLADAANMFDRLASVPEVRKRMVDVVNADRPSAGRDEVAAIVAKDLRHALFRPNGDSGAEMNNGPHVEES